MVLIGRHLLLIPSVLDVDVDPPVGALSGERLGSSERLGAFGEYGGPTVLMFDGPLLARPHKRGRSSGRCLSYRLPSFAELNATLVGLFSWGRSSPSSPD